MRLDKFYDFETCTNETTLFKILDKLKDKDLLQYQILDYTIHILDCDLTLDEEMEVIEELAELEVYPIEDNDSEDIYWQDYDDFN